MFTLNRRKRKQQKNLRPTLEVVSSNAMRNAANTLLSNIEFSSVDEPIKSVAITSTIPNEGKFTVALALASAASQMGKTVLVMEGDLRRHSLRATLNAHPQHGLHATLAGSVSLDEAVVETPLKGVMFLDAEPGIPNPEELLSSNRYTALIREARESYDLVIVDTPPVAAFADAAMVAHKVDGVLMVVRENFTDKRNAQLAMEQLRASSTRILGLVMNCEERSSGGGYGYYYGYYYEDKKVAKDSPEAQEALKAVGEQ
ncbi:MAG: CpsD/CapB family tyrosine-protein kinase [Atopobiaceae bacterium]|nr:CpsD/CapB family tyrosine-protein kinase [Atopobiaceae bacterium]